MTREELHYQIAKIIAETDSIGYCSKYTQKMFNTLNDETEEEYKSIAGSVMKLVQEYIDEYFQPLKAEGREVKYQAILDMGPLENAKIALCQLSNKMGAVLIDGQGNPVPCDCLNCKQ